MRGNAHVVHVHSNDEPPTVIGWCLCKTNTKRALYRGKTKKWKPTVPTNYFTSEQEAEEALSKL